ncbi:unnamed protein product [Meganyctiphanes norvegica]|uniref:Secreted protein n=1 Tax=Meganyctiphanes norvegica TaxID=48144 RepID=A0AAV2QBW4_MEGNR
MQYVFALLYRTLLNLYQGAVSYLYLIKCYKIKNSILEFLHILIAFHQKLAEMCKWKWGTRVEDFFQVFCTIHVTAVHLHFVCIHTAQTRGYLHRGRAWEV